MATRHYARTVAFIGWIVFRFPALQGLLQEHLEDNDGEILPDVLLFEIRKWVESKVETEGESQDILSLVESLKIGLHDDEYELCALVRTSFLDDLAEEPHPASALRRLFGLIPER